MLFYLIKEKPSVEKTDGGKNVPKLTEDVLGQ